MYGRAELGRHFPDYRPGLTTRPGQVVHFVEPAAAWAFLVSRAFWRVSASEDRASFLPAQQVLRAALAAALGSQLTTLDSVANALGVTELVEKLPRAVLAENVRRALVDGDAGRPFTRAHLLGPEPIETLVRNVPLELLWRRVIEPVARQAGLIDEVPASYQTATSDRRALDALLRSKTGMTMELDISELLLEDDEPGQTAPSVRPPPLPSPAAAEAGRAPRPPPLPAAADEKAALRAFLRTKTGRTMELRREDLMLDKDPRREED